MYTAWQKRKNTHFAGKNSKIQQNMTISYKNLCKSEWKMQAMMYIFYPLYNNTIQDILKCNKNYISNCLVGMRSFCGSSKRVQY